jgi:hypothetical protein
MLEARISRALMAMGAGIGLLGIGVWALDLHLNVPDWMVRIAMFKLTAIAVVGLLAAGALLGRHARTSSLVSGRVPAQIGEADAEPLRQRERDLTPQPVDRSDSPP